MINLSVNLNKIALIRNSREGNYPAVTDFALTAINAGTNGITVHPRPDQRHIRPEDVRQLGVLVNQFSSIEYNIEGNPFAPAQGSYPGLLSLVKETRPHQCTLVPDSDEQLTSDHGFDLKQSGKQVEPIIRELQDMGVRVSLFMDPDPYQIELAHGIGADRIEFYTGPFAAALNDKPSVDKLLSGYIEAAIVANDLGLGINAGHDLNLDNLALFCTVPGLQEVSIGHALTVDALYLGMDSAVRAYKKILQT